MRVKNKGAHVSGVDGSRGGRRGPLGEGGSKKKEETRGKSRTARSIKFVHPRDSSSTQRRARKVGGGYPWKHRSNKAAKALGWLNLCRAEGLFFFGA
jgi:hypothetical protein